VRYKALIALGVVAVLGFAAATLPASVLGRIAGRHGVQAASWTGTVWAGAADGVTSNGTALGAVRWTLSPWSLLTGRLRGHAELAPPDGSVNGDFALRLGGRTELANVNVDVPLAWLNTVIRTKFRGWSGRVSARLASLVLADGWPVAAQGAVAIDELSAPPSRGGRVGSYEIVFPAATSADDGLRGRLTDTDGPLAVSGELVLAPGRSFDLQGFVARRGSERTPFDNAIQLLGSPDETGRRPFGLSGTL
jgi:hypothetical protein